MSTAERMGMTVSHQDAPNDSIAQSAAVFVQSLNRDLVLQKCDYFIDVQLWPLRRELDPRKWLSNFQPTELEYACQLLNSFLYFSRPLVEHIFVATFHALSRTFHQVGQPLLRTRLAWQSFLNRLLITRVTGEQPSDADSAFQFSRMARQLLSIPEDRIVSPEAAITTLLDGGPRPVVFVDDFVGSGRQFLTTWHRAVQLSPALTSSFSKLAQTQRDATFYYCPLICTQYGLTRIQPQCPEVIIRPGHVLSSHYSAVAPDSIIWPLHMRAHAPQFLESVSTRAGIPADQWRGFHGLALTLAFEKAVPDATLPLFYWDDNGWKPLVPRQ